MSLQHELPPTYAIFSISDFQMKDGQVDHVIAKLTYAASKSLSHTVRVSREEMIKFFQSGEQFFFKASKWTLTEDLKISPVETGS